MEQFCVDIWTYSMLPECYESLLPFTIPSFDQNLESLHMNMLLPEPI